MEDALNEVVIYRIITVLQVDHFVNTEYVLHSDWTLEAPGGLPVVTSKSECTRHKQKYVMQYNMENTSLEKLLHIVQVHLTAAEAREIFQKSPWFWNVYQHWLKGGVRK